MIHIIISGDVQMVGFRQFLRSRAHKLGIKGWVKNLPDGRVEAMFVGTDENVKKMVELAKNGPFLAKVRDVKIENLEDLTFKDFNIIKD